MENSAFHAPSGAGVPARQPLVSFADSALFRQCHQFKAAHPSTGYRRFPSPFGGGKEAVGIATSLAPPSSGISASLLTLKGNVINLRGLRSLGKDNYKEIKRLPSRRAPFLVPP
ncbi:MAG: hypothetical protein LUD83_05680, partial [Clostridiales bacterium]|nr:hypothetical protein [Clostridiales bacterium]